MASNTSRIPGSIAVAIVVWFTAGIAGAQATSPPAAGAAQPQVVYVQPQPAPPPTAAPGQPQPQIVYVQQQPYGAPAAQTPTGTPHTRSRPNLGLIIPGAVMLGVGWILNFIVGLPAGDDPFGSGSSEQWDAFRFASLIPLAGPWVQLGVKPTDFRADYWGLWLILDGVLQGAGALMLIIGVATPSEETFYADLGGGARIGIAPSVGPTHAGIAIDGRF